METPIVPATPEPNKSIKFLAVQKPSWEVATQEMIPFLDQELYNIQIHVDDMHKL